MHFCTPSFSSSLWGWGGVEGKIAVLRGIIPITFWTQVSFFCCVKGRAIDSCEGFRNCLSLAVLVSVSG